ncbi:ammonium transporter [Sporichthya sp.]|uniref:ammonium transporter n=1 Tax=Sporichthya sp. TaxID=65475 RepID=UPI00185EC79C|nr:ammonium transporter [Sporichthya sp.]MBA3745008.1 ammonium transporter [Sporichthya sp.]
MPEELPTWDTGDTAWMLISCALVLLMTPGLAFFYGGMVRMKSVLNMLMMSAAALAIVTIVWVLYGYSLALTDDQGSGLIGSRDAFGLNDQIFLGDDTTAPALAGTIPESVFVAFQLMFAIITVALISGAIADRAKFGTWCVFVFIWVSVVYVPVAHWVFYFGSDTSAPGWIVDFGVNDFAGGTAVHINAGAAALALVLIIGKRKGWRRDPMRPHNVPFVMLGAALLWFGWFGFNAGSAVGSNGLAGVTFLNTQVATAAATIGWLVVEKIRDGHFTTLGAASGMVAGLVAITPSCNTVNPLGAMAIGLIAGALCCAALTLKFKLGFDDSLDVVAVHLVGGLAGTLLIGVFATSDAPFGVDGLLYGGDAEQLGRQAVGAFAVMGYSFVVTLIIGFILHKTMGFRVDEDSELEGIDVTSHGEAAYEFTAVGTPMARPTGGGAGFGQHAPPPVAGGMPGATPRVDA